MPRPPCRRVALFSGWRFIAAAPLECKRLDVVEALRQPALFRCGFRFVIADDMLGSYKPLRVFAGRDGVASELPAKEQ